MRFIGKQVTLRACGDSVALFFEDTRIATHQRAAPGQRRTNPADLPEGRRELRHRSQQYWEERADAIGEEVGAYVREVFASDDVLLHLRTVQAIVTHLEGQPVRRARAACARARYFASYTYGDRDRPGAELMHRLHLRRPALDAGFLLRREPGRRTARYCAPYAARPRTRAVGRDTGRTPEFIAVDAESSTRRGRPAARARGSAPLGEAFREGTLPMTGSWVDIAGEPHHRKLLRTF